MCNSYFSGGLGQLGTGLAKLLRENYGTENIILSDIIKPSKEILADGKFIYRVRLGGCVNLLSFHALSRLKIVGLFWYNIILTSLIIIFFLLRPIHICRYFGFQKFARNCCISSNWLVDSLQCFVECSWWK